MPLARLKTLYCIAAMAIGTLLAVLGGFVGWLAAVLILASALPAWKMVIRSAAKSAIIGFNLNLLNEATRHTKPTDPALEDRFPDQ